jgi:hypothetical protein
VSLTGITAEQLLPERNKKNKIENNFFIIKTIFIFA